MSASASQSQRAPRSGPTPGRELARIALDAALDKRARDVTVMDLRGISGEVDYFVIATGESDLQIRAIVDGVVDAIRKQAGERPVARDGQPGTSRWIVLDYFDLAVHVFDPELRAHYDLERLWGDAPTETVTDEQPEAKLLAGDAPSSLTPPPSRAAEAAPVADDEAAPDDEAE
ncbi:ribosome silencing factor [Rubrivirga sp. SAORIC476]|uniref:ribosome silencing factor n=1 Tax=Rubrivirga sp. SAORIC476 TaxID=1961794 RepID=UPI000BA9AE95|nr:ribosome silencing factor [Rubrivirga sp. SAORIC476]MAQ91920.1 ribosome silencing factor [Rhodothermaceae bacterium]MBC13146.1 ribosome silencing factor [Rhodothermaceae bacterium]PAP79242.1 ribosome silencing factor [Rubrivirga sp. SAORIC476]